MRQRSLGAAIRKRRELITESSKLKKECEDRIEDLKVQIEALKIKHADVEKVLAETERKDRARVIHAPKEGGRVGTLLGLGKQRTEELRDSLRDLKFQRDDYKSRLGLLEGIMTTFKEQYNPNFNDEGVKRAVRAWEDYVAVMKLPELDEGKERDLVEVLKTDEENGLKWADWENADLADDTAVCKSARLGPYYRTDWLTSDRSIQARRVSPKTTTRLDRPEAARLASDDGGERHPCGQQWRRNRVAGRDGRAHAGLRRIGRP